MSKQASLKRAVSLAGGQSALARKVTDILRSQGKLKKTEKISQGHVWYWIERKKEAPLEYVPAISQAVEQKVTKHELNPDFFQTEVA